MSNIASFFFGSIFGIYLSQSYNIPNIKNTIDNIVEQLKDFEKKNKK